MTPSATIRFRQCREELAAQASGAAGDSARNRSKPRRMRACCSGGRRQNSAPCPRARARRAGGTTARARRVPDGLALGASIQRIRSAVAEKSGILGRYSRVSRPQRMDPAPVDIGQLQQRRGLRGFGPAVKGCTQEADRTSWRRPAPGQSPANAVAGETSDCFSRKTEVGQRITKLSRSVPRRATRGSRAGWSTGLSTGFVDKPARPSRSANYVRNLRFS